MTAEKDKDSAKRNVVEWLKEPGDLRIAEYQRSYCWPESFITNFVKTILAAFDENRPDFGPADLGLIVLETYQEDKDKIERIADGQQRLMTFALLTVAVLDKEEFSCPCSRIRVLLGADTPKPCGSPSEKGKFFADLETLLHAQLAYATIKKVLYRELPEGQTIDSIRKTIGEHLRQVTFGLLELPVNSENAKADLCVKRLFEAFNTTAKPLNGGQILKARHYGAIAVADQLRKLEKYWQNKSEHLAEAATRPLTIISNDEFVDSPNQDAWYWPGRGFVQAVQGILLGQDGWRFALNMQGNERMDPFDRMQGIEQTRAYAPDADGNIDSFLQNYAWKADAPLVFEKGWGFFGMTRRLKHLFADLAQGLESVRSQINDNLGGRTDQILSDRNIVTQAFCLGLIDAIQTMGLVKKYIDDRKKNSNNSKNSNYVDLALYKLRLINAIARENTNTSADAAGVDHALVAMSSVNYWLGIQADGQRAENSSGCMMTVVFSILLCWADHFEKPGWDCNKESVRARDDDSLPADRFLSAATLRQLALWLFFAARFDSRCQYSSVLARLHVDEAIAAAHFSLDLDNAWWRFMKQARRDGGVQNFFMGLREFFSENEDIQAPKALDSLMASYLD